MTEPVIAQKSPIPVDVEEGKDYWWCTCGKSKSQPFCDSSHSGTDYLPMQYTATESKTIYFCACKQTSNKPLCDGTHSKL